MFLNAIYKSKEVTIVGFIQGATGETIGPVAIFYYKFGKHKNLYSDLIKYFEVKKENNL